MTSGIVILTKFPAVLRSLKSMEIDSIGDLSVESTIRTVHGGKILLNAQSDGYNDLRAYIDETAIGVIIAMASPQNRTNASRVGLSGPVNPGALNASGSPDSIDAGGGSWKDRDPLF